MTKNTNYYLAMIFAMFLWGSSWVSTKILVDIAPPMILGFFRYTIAAILFTVLVSATSSSFSNILNKSTMKSMLLAGLTGVFGFMVLSVLGTSYTTASQASIVAGINPVTVSMFAHLIHKERLASKWQYGGFVFAFLGVLAVVGIQSLIAFNADYFLGNIILIGSMISWGLYSSISRHAMEKASPIEVTAGSVYFGLPLFALGTIPELHLIPTIVTRIDFWWNITFLGAFSTFLGFTLYIMSIKRIGITKSGAFISLVPVFGTLVAIIVLAEIILWTFIVGLILVVLGILILNAPAKREANHSTPASNL